MRPIWWQLLAKRLGAWAVVGAVGGACAPALGGDVCSTATPVGVGTLTAVLSDNFASGVVDSCGFGNTVDEWYTFIPVTDGELRVSTCHPGTQFDTVLSVFDACPADGGVEIACNDDALTAPLSCELGGLNRFSSVGVGVSAGVPYFIRVSVYADNFGCDVCTGTSYEISFDLIIGPGNDECAGAQGVATGATPGSLLDNTGLTDDDDSCAINNSIDEWFSYTPGSNGPAMVTTCSPGTTFDTVLSVFDGCSGAEIGCNDDATGIVPPECALPSGAVRKSVVEFMAQRNATYYIRVSAFNNAVGGGEFELIVDGPEVFCDCDWNFDGFLNNTDFFDFVNDYFDGAGPMGQADYNADGFQNAQDFFDYINCFFNPPAGC